jgi:predicted TIM-barrel fold metal-dependent hydrolase
MSLNLFDCHLHVEKGLDEYDLPISNANVIYNTVESFQINNQKYPNYYSSLIFDINHFDFIETCVSEGKIVALKIHSRLQKIGVDEYDLIIKYLKKLNRNITIIYDAFYFGPEMSFQPNLDKLIDLINKFPSSNFVIAHSGGYKILEYFFHLRTFKNVGFDLSFSLQYLSDTSCFSDMVKLINYTDKSKLFFGSDFPFAKPSTQLNELNSIMNNLNFSERIKNDILESNWVNFLT